MENGTTERQPVVTMKDGRAIADSRDVAATFGKRHDHVLRDIRELIGKGVPNFGETYFVNEQNGQTYPAYEMDRDGFSLLAMGFTGEKALKWKLRYIEAFNAMEVKLRDGDNLSPSVAITALANVVQQLLARSDQDAERAARREEESNRQFAILARRLDAMDSLLPMMVKAELANGLSERPGRTAGEIWHEFRLPTIKNGPQWLANCLEKMGAAMPNGARAQLGRTVARKFDHDKARACMRNGLHDRAKRYVAERSGQGVLKLVQTR